MGCPPVRGDNPRALASVQLSIFKSSALTSKLSHCIVTFKMDVKQATNQSANPTSLIRVLVSLL